MDAIAQDAEHAREWIELVADYNADHVRRAALRQVLRDAAVEHYATQPPAPRYSLDEVLAQARKFDGGYAVREDLVHCPALKRELLEYLSSQGFDRFELVGDGGMSVVIGDGRRVARISAIGTEPTELETPEFLQPLTRWQGHSKLPSPDNGETVMKVEILPQLLPLEQLVRDGRMNAVDAQLIGFSVGASMHQAHPAHIFDDNEPNVGILPDGTPVLFDRDCVMTPEPLPDDPSHVMNSEDAWVARTMRLYQSAPKDFDWIMPDGQWKQHALLRERVTPTAQVLPKRTMAPMKPLHGREDGITQIS